MSLRLSTKATFFSEIASVLSSGIPIAEALELVARRRFPATSAAGRVVAELATVVRSGEPLSRGMERQLSAFEGVEIAVVRSGEQSGHVEDALRFVAASLDKRVARRRRLLLGLAYPAFVLHFVVALAPLALQPLRGFGPGYFWRALPGFLVFDGGIASGIWLHFRFSRNRRYVEFLRKVPIVGRAWVDAGLARYLRALSALYGAGTPLREATRLSAMACAEPTLDDDMDHVTAGIERGETLSAQLARTGKFPDEVRRSVEIGEESGTLGEKLDRVAAMFEEKADRALDLAVQVVAKAAYVLAALGVTIIVVSFYGRMYSEIS
ncbi:MAG: type II secretion system F family protein [Planctomycetes bacterium]|nr:type II secretion system F family protein [Planctomycetota bacterium]